MAASDSSRGGASTQRSREQTHRNLPSYKHLRTKVENFKTRKAQLLQSDITKHVWFLIHSIEDDNTLHKLPFELFLSLQLPL